MSHVLIVDDHEENRNLLKCLLEVNGFRVTAAGNGLEALDAARRNPPDAVVSDALMPEMDGFALCRAWMRDAALKAVPFIFCSANSPQTKDQEFGMALGAARYLAKPVEAEVLLRELRTVLKQPAGPGAPGPTPPLDDTTFHALHESALGRAVENKIAELEAANRKLQESEARFRSLVEMSSDFYWESDAEHRLVQRASAAKKASGVWLFARGAQIGERRWEIPHLSPDEAGWAAHRATLDAHLPFRDFVLSRLGTDGSERFISISGDPLFDAAGAFSGYRGVGTDITDRKRADERLRASEARITEEQRRTQELIEALPNPIYFKGSDGRYLGVNRAWETYFGRKRQDFLGKTVHELYVDAPEVAQRLAADDRAVWEHPDGHSYETTITAADGKPRTAIFYKAAFAGADGAAAGLVGTIVDITERKAAEAKIHRLTQFYAALSQCNEAIVRCASEDELFHRICRVAVEFGGMKMAWIGVVDAKAGSIRPAASFGDRAPEYLRDIQLSVHADEPHGRGPVGTAIRENAPAWFQDFQRDPRAAPWRERSAHFGWASVAALPLCRNGVPVGVLALYAGEAQAFDEAVQQLLVEMATDIGFALDNFAREAARERAEKQVRRYVAQLQTAFMSTVEVATTLGEMRDPYTAGHQRKVAEIAVAIGAELGLDEHRQEGLRVAGYLHDIGKITLPAEILSKPGKLSAIELQLIQAHSQAGYDVLKGVKFPWPVAEVALQHHERMDGSGYPQGLKGEAILLEARIAAVADVIEAMYSHRPYRAGLGIETALAEIERGRGSAYDAEVADACLRLFRDKGYSISP